MTNEDIVIPASYSKEEYFSICYECSHTRKKKADKCLSVRAKPKPGVAVGVYHCMHCEAKGMINQYKTQEQFTPMYQVPEKKNFTKLSDKGLKFFTDRFITQEVVIANKIVEEKGWLVFPYLENGQLINVKKRNTDSKDFRQSAGSKAIMYNYDRCKGQKEIIVCEGELDCMAFEVAGFTNATSVNQGAPNANDKNIDKKLECLNNSYDLFEEAETVYIAVDKDENGKRLEEELIRRIGAEKCKVVNWDAKYKDANDLLRFEGKEALGKALANASDVKVEGIWTVDDVFEDMLADLRNGPKRGTTTYFAELDECWTWRTGDVNIWTGYNNEGKTQFLLQLCLIKAMAEGWKFAVFSPENIPVRELYADLVHSYIGRSADKFFPNNLMSEAQLAEGAKFMRDHFFIVYPPKNFTLEIIEEKFLYLIRRKGVRGCILDPYNMIEHMMNPGEREDLYISRFMSSLTRFTKENDVSMHLVAHQNTPRPNEKGNYPKPILYNIKGGGTFADKADNVLVVHRPNRGASPSDTQVVFYSDKIKKQKLVGIPGACHGIIFDRSSNRYFLNGVSPIELMRNTDSPFPKPPEGPSRQEFRHSTPSEFSEEKITEYQAEPPPF
ncbi:bifunctional DNA primase/helicase [Pontibacter beigongshangensis]|uniref:bifunctional DNA primase/helicase n=1 Tax=Pontibacter beigongshangensis TaxID=2574733 RepID=UPI00164F9234|nr:DnaB-like helicase C-terminal domain-containing protein [Pontibacter beigongshangensis]